MKLKIFHSVPALLAIASLLSACQADMEAPKLEVPVAKFKANTTILELKQAYEGKSGQVVRPGTEVIDPETGDIIGGEQCIIHGRVVSSDATGNIYKSLVIQDETAALAFSINQGNLYNDYRLGQEIVVDMTGLTIGYYRGLQQIGSLNEYYDGEPQLGFMAYDRWVNAANLNGLPNPDFSDVKINSSYPDENAYCIVMNDFDEVNQGTLPQMQSQLVEFRNVHFQITPGEETYAPYQESVNRTLVDANGKTLTVRNSGYSNFYTTLLPEGTGAVRGILSYYGSDWQLLLRSLDDVMITTKGEESDPFTVPDITSNQFEGYQGWTVGYIVGSVKAGVSSVSSAADVVFGAAGAELDNNLLIAQTPGETDYTRCAIVQLPLNSSLRYSANLLDNPGNVGKQLKVYGTLGFDLGLPGVVNPKAARGEFLIDGQVPSDGSEAPAAAGSGTESDPYNVTAVMESTQDLNDVWVEGYVAGYVISGDFSQSTCQFSATEVAGSANWLNQSNVILSGVKAALANVDNSVPCQLNAKSRPVIGLKDHPEAYGVRVKVKCKIATYLGVRGVRNIAEIVVL